MLMLAILAALQQGGQGFLCRLSDANAEHHLFKDHTGSEVIETIFSAMR